MVDVPEGQAGRLWHRHDEDTGALARLDQAAGPQRGDGLPHHGAADALLGAQLRFARQARSDGIAAAGDPVPKGAREIDHHRAPLRIRPGHDETPDCDKTGYLITGR